jgi:uncharacterized protein YndB with AHSA1/START domain
MRLDVVVEEVLPHPIDAVWAKLVDAASISDWLMATADFRPEVGARFRLKTDTLSPDGWISAQVVELDAPRRMAWSWAASDGVSPSTVTFDLTAEAGGTRLTLRHFGDIDEEAGRTVQAGWPGRVALIRRLLDGTS